MSTSGTLLAVCLSLIGQRATGTVQLPIVRNIGVGTTVSVPDSGRSLVASDKRVIGHSAGRARLRQSGGDAFVVGVTIHNIDEVEQRNAWRVAYRLFERGRIDEAIQAFEALAAQSESVSAKTAAERELASLAAIGEAAFDRAAEWADSGDAVEAAKLIDKVLADFGKLIATPERNALQRRLRQRPELAESRNGAAAMELYEKGLANKAKGRTSVAKLFFQQAARQRGTRAGTLAEAELLAMGVKPTIRGNTRPTKSTDAVEKPSIPSSQRWLDLARLYRDVDPQRSKDYYDKALKDMPANDATIEAIRQEAELAKAARAF